MKAKVVYKQGGASHSVDVGNLALDRPSVVFLKLAPESVARYERRGDDLVLVLKDGQEILVHDFYAHYPQAGQAEHAEQASGDAAAAGDGPDAGNDRSDLVLIDDNGVAWWGQYTSPWSEFHFTEIEWGGGGFVLWPWLLAALGVADAAIATSGHDSRHASADDSSSVDTTAPSVTTTITTDANNDGTLSSSELGTSSTAEVKFTLSSDAAVGDTLTYTVSDGTTTTTTSYTLTDADIANGYVTATVDAPDDG
ncbi:MAG: BapA prefix-like domain-containing protein, partial [Pseudoxanthomonas sp.]